MGYIGQAPANKVVTSADIEDGVISAADLGANSVDSSELVDGSIDTSHLADNQVTLAKMAGLARGKLIYGDASGDPAALAVGAADEVLTHDGTDFDWAAAGGGITEADFWRLTANFAGDADPISSNLERVDDGSFSKIGTGMSVSSGVWTFPSTGIWNVVYRIQCYQGNSEAYMQGDLEACTDHSTGPTWDGVSYTVSSANIDQNSSIAETFVDVTDTAEVKVQFVIYQEDGANICKGDSGTNLTCFKFIRLGDT